MMNSKVLLGDARPEGGKMVLWNVLMLIALSIATFGAGWSAYGKVGIAGPVLMAVIFAVALVSFIGKNKQAA